MSKFIYIIFVYNFSSFLQLDEEMFFFQDAHAALKSMEAEGGLQDTVTKKKWFEIKTSFVSRLCSARSAESHCNNRDSRGQ